METRTVVAAAVALLAPFALGGCLTGLLYTDVTRPLTTHFRHTPVGTKSVELDVKQISEPIFTGIKIQWDSNAIGDIARANGIETVYFADIRKFSILLGVYGTETVIISGKPFDPPESAPSSGPASTPASRSADLEERPVQRHDDVGP